MSNRERGWKSRAGEFMEDRIPQCAKVKRWDGAARACTAWDSLKRDAELWHKNGNCLVHLYRKGQSRRGPAFRVPLSNLLAARCHPLIKNFLIWDDTQGPMPRLDPGHLDAWSRRNPRARVELYIPPPRNSSKPDGIRFHLAIRNLLAWVFRRSMVGEHLGAALIGLMSSMEDLRCQGENHLAGLMDYMDEEGYLAIKNQPIHALAILRLAEHFQLKDLYINAFTHCAGMNDQLLAYPEYQAVSSMTRQLMRRAKVEMDLKLGRAGVMLQNFLEDDLSEAHIGLTDGGRAHLERFRGFLVAFFAARLGYYPPESIDQRSLIFEPEVYRLMRDNFQALHDYLVDTRIDLHGETPLSALGGICTLQTVHGFDTRNRFASLPHPLPRLPGQVPPPKSRRLSWLAKSDKLSPDRRLVTHAALVKATNHTDLAVMNNELVVAYRRFEEDAVCSPLKFDRLEKLTQADARKIRWILIYAVYQVLRSCTQPPAECQDTEGVHYNIAISTANLPPWKESPPPRQPRRSEVALKPAASMSSVSLPTTPSVSTSILSFSADTNSTPYEIKPDIDYFALTHQPEEPRRPSTATTARSRGRSTGPPVRLRSLQGSLRRSLSAFRNSYTSTDSPPEVPKPVRRLSYHEIVVEGYGNGTNEVQLDGEQGGISRSFTVPDLNTLSLRPEDLAPLASRSHSTSSNSSASTATSTNSSDISKMTASTTSSIPLDGDSCCSPPCGCPDTLAIANSYDEDVVGDPVAILPRRGSTFMAHTAASSVYSVQINMEDEPESERPPALPRRNSKRQSRAPVEIPSPLRIRKRAGGLLRQPSATPENDQTTADLYGKELVVASTKEYIQDVQDVWDQFINIGGLTEPTAQPLRAQYSP
ncbi:hypothetical protein GQ53DRAFT_678225 [Thozetella sp. PMI_491]|nr:hypothetical protein GQ53DRAFT_678225 [Thozetella sp. PMI_491]